MLRGPGTVLSGPDFLGTSPMYIFSDCLLVVTKFKEVILISIRKLLLLILMVAVIFGMTSLLPQGPLPAHGISSGVVCIVQTSTACPPNPLGITGTGASVVVNVAIQNSASLTGFTIFVKTDNATLGPTSASIVGTVVKSPTILGECINGKAIHGSCGVLDGPGIVSLNVIGSFTGTTAPTTGLLFTITYSIKATPLAGAPVVFQTGCALSSNGNFCVNILTPSGGSAPEVLETATFVDSNLTYLLGANPSSLTLNVNSTATSTINATAFNTFTGTVGLAATVGNSTVTSRPTAGLSPGSISLTSHSTSGTVTLTVTSVPATPGGVYLVNVTGTVAGQPTRFAVVTVTVPQPDFVAGASPNFVTGLNANATGTSTITLTSVNGFGGTVSLSLSSTAGITPSLARSSLLVKASSLNSTTLSFKAKLSGTYFVNVTGTCFSGGECTTPAQTHIATVTVKVVDFTVTATTSSFNIQPKATVATNITVAPASLTGFTDNVTLTVTAPTGLTGSFNCYPNVCSSTVLKGPTVAVLGSGVVNLTITASSTLGPGTFTVTVTANSTNLIHSTTITLIGTDFKITASPQTISQLLPGSSGTSTLTVTSLNGFAGSVSVSVPLHPTATSTVTLNVTSVTLTAGSSAHVGLSVTDSAAETVTATVTGTGSGLTHTSAVIVNIVDFTISANPTTLSFAAGSNGATAITITGLNGFAGNVTLTANPSSGLSAQFSTNFVLLSSTVNSATVTLTVSATVAASYTVTVTGTLKGSVPSFSHTTPTITVTATANPDFKITLQGSVPTLNAGDSTTITNFILVTSLNQFTGPIFLSVNISPSPTMGLTANLNPTYFTLASAQTVPASLMITASLAGNYMITISATNGTVTHTAPSFTVTVVDFTIQASQLTIGPLNPGVPGISTITITALNSFTGTVALTASPSTPAGLTCAPLGTVTLPPTSGTSILNCSTTKPGNYTLIVTGTNANLKHSTAVITFVVEDFSITPISTTLTLSQGTTSIDTIQLTNLGQITATISLTATINPTGPTINLSRLSLTLTPAPAGIGSSDLTINTGLTTPGTYTITVNATLGTLIHLQPITITVVQPSIKFVSVSGIPTSSVTTGQEVDVKVDVSNLSPVGLSFNITLDVGSVTVDIHQLTLNPGQDSGTITLKWATSSYPAGDYTINIRIVNLTTTGANPTSVNPALENAPSQATVTLTSPPGVSFLQGNTNLIIAIVAAAIIAAVAAVLLIRRRKSTPVPAL